MKKTIPLIFSLIVMMTVPVQSPGNIPGSDPFRYFSSLETQLAANVPDGSDASRARDLLNSWFDPENKELVRGMEMLLAGEGETNHALTLLLHLLDKGCYVRGETMPLALALANNYLYSLVSPVIREEIKKDVVGHYRFYRTIIAWQKKAFEISYDLSRVPLIAQIYWADRRVYPPEDDIVFPVRTLSDYKEYVDSIDTLEYFHRLAVEKKLYRGSSVPKIGRYVYLYVHHANAADGLPRHLYDPSSEKIRTIIDRIPHDPGPETSADKKVIRYRGVDYNVNSFVWINYQRRLCEQTGHSIGLCEVTSLIEMILFKAMGMPACNMVRFSKVDSKLMGGHVFAGYYDPFRKRWHNLEMIRKFDKPYLMEFVIHKTIWNHRIRELQGKVFEQGLAPRFFKVLEFGTLERDFDKVFLSNNPSWINTLFGQDALPDNLADRDSDGIPDFEEKILGTDPSRPDTAEDGVSDLWKLNHGYDPKAPIGAGSLDAPPIDGLGGGFADSDSRLTAFKVPRFEGGKRDDVPELDMIYTGRFGDRLYVRFSFHNDIRKCARKSQYLSMINGGGSGRLESFNLFIENGAVFPSNDKVKVMELDFFNDIRGANIRDVEFMIPIKCFDNAKTVTIRFFTALVQGETTVKL